MHPVHPAGAYWPNPDSICVEHEQGDIWTWSGLAYPALLPRSARRNPRLLLQLQTTLREGGAKAGVPGVFQHNPMFSSIQCE